MLIFYVIGCIVKLILDRNIDKMEDVKTLEEELSEKKVDIDETSEEKTSEEKTAEEYAEKEKQVEENE